MGDSHIVWVIYLRSGTPHGVLLRTVVLRKIFPTENVPYRLEGDGAASDRSNVCFISKTNVFPLFLLPQATKIESQPRRTTSRCEVEKLQAYCFRKRKQRWFQRKTIVCKPTRRADMDIPSIFASRNATTTYGCFPYRSAGS